MAVTARVIEVDTIRERICLDWCIPVKDTNSANSRPAD